MLQRRWQWLLVSVLLLLLRLPLRVLLPWALRWPLLAAAPAAHRRATHRWRRPYNPTGFEPPGGQGH